MLDIKGQYWSISRYILLNISSSLVISLYSFFKPYMTSIFDFNNHKWNTKDTVYKLLNQRENVPFLSIWNVFVKRSNSKLIGNECWCRPSSYTSLEGIIIWCGTNSNKKICLIKRKMYNTKNHIISIFTILSLLYKTLLLGENYTTYVCKTIKIAPLWSS